MITFKEKLNTLFDDYNKLITSKNVPLEDGNGILTRYKYPILTAYRYQCLPQRQSFQIPIHSFLYRTGQKVMIRVGGYFPIRENLPDP